MSSIYQLAHVKFSEACANANKNMPFSYHSKIKRAQLLEEKGHVLQLPVQNIVNGFDQCVAR
jgi:hypothetical protein